MKCYYGTFVGYCRYISKVVNNYDKRLVDTLKGIRSGFLKYYQQVLDDQSIPTALENYYLEIKEQCQDLKRQMDEIIDNLELIHFISVFDGYLALAKENKDNQFYNKLEKIKAKLKEFIANYRN